MLSIIIWNHNPYYFTRWKLHYEVAQCVWFYRDVAGHCHLEIENDYGVLVLLRWWFWQLRWICLKSIKVILVQDVFQDDDDDDDEEHQGGANGVFQDDDEDHQQENRQGDGDLQVLPPGKYTWL